MDNRVLEDCVNLNDNNECCADTPVGSEINLKKYYNTDNDGNTTNPNPVWYKQEYSDELNLYFDYIANGSKYCKAEFESLTWIMMINL